MVENFFAIRDLIWAIYFRVEEPDPGKPSLDDLFRKLRARINTFEAQCRQKSGGTLTARAIGKAHDFSTCDAPGALLASCREGCTPVGLGKVRGRDGRK